MVDQCGQVLVGVGIYSVPDAARLTGVSTHRIRRWLQGYSYQRDGKVRRQPPVWRPELGTVEGDLCLSFQDLMEVRVVNELRNRGIAWKWIRKVGEVAARDFGTSHPFCTHRFATQGKTIVMHVLQDACDLRLLDLARGQLLLHIIEPYLCDLEFDRETALRWWPLGKDHEIVIDPARGFGKPILSSHGIPTRVLARSYDAEGSYATVAEWFEVDESSVQEAVRFERGLKGGKAA